MKSLYFRMCIAFTVVIAISCVLSFLASNAYYQWKIKPQNDIKLTGMANEMRSFIEGHQSGITDYLNSVGKLGYKIYMVDHIGNEQFYGHKFRNYNLAKDVIPNVLAGQTYHGVGNYPRNALITGFFDNELVNSIGVPVKINGESYAMFIRPDAEVQFGELRIFFAMLLGLAILFSLLFVMIITLHIVRPITRLSKATQDIAKGRFNVKVETRRQDEIGQLAHQFNRMSQELGRSDKAKQEFVANVSHEFESPLTSIQGFAHTLKDNKLNSEQQQHYLSIIEDESKRLSMLSKQLLTLSSLDHAGEALRIENYDLRAQLRAVIQVLEWKLTQKELAIKLSVPELYIQGEQELLYQVWMNLINNAIKYTPHGGEIAVSAIVEDEKYVIKITDNGQGIASEHLAHIFDRFYKVDQVRSREGNGDNSTGLGLAIVQKIVHLHQGTVEVRSKEGEGTTFVVTLPPLLLTQL